jgi:GxxExxY protein
LTEKIIGLCIDVQKHLGPGLLESAYEECLCYELAESKVLFERQKAVGIHYKNLNLDCGYRIDILVNNEVILELKSVEKILPIHEAQILTYMKLSKIKVGLLINFNSLVVSKNIKRFVF